MIKAIELEKVSSVYSGKSGRCCCGCSGKYTYAQAHRDWASKNRGYPVMDEDVNDRVVRLHVAKINNRLNEAEDLGECVSWDNGTGRVYVAYLKTEG